MIPSVVGNTVGGLLSGVLIKRHGRYKVLTLIASVSSGVAFTLLLIFWRGHNSVWQSVFVFPAGFGTGVAHSTTFVALAVGTSDEDQAIASSGLYLSGSVGAVAGLSFASAVFQGSLRSALNKVLIVGGIPGGQEVCFQSQV